MSGWHSRKQHSSSLVPLNFQGSTSKPAEDSKHEIPSMIARKRPGSIRLLSKLMNSPQSKGWPAFIKQSMFKQELLLCGCNPSRQNSRPIFALASPVFNRIYFWLSRWPFLWDFPSFHRDTRSKGFLWISDWRSKSFHFFLWDINHSSRINL